jgi:hypothetical protein
MSKQISYPDFITRVFCTSLDLLIIAFLVTATDPIIRKHSCLFSLKEIIASNNLDSSNLPALEEFFSTYKFSSQNDAMALLLCKIITPISEIIMLIVYTLFFWFKWGQTPAKIIMRLKIVDKTTLQKPSKYQLIKRLAFTILYPLSILFSIVSRNKQSLHDLLSDTTVIKV